MSKNDVWLISKMGKSEQLLPSFYLEVAVSKSE